MEKTEPVQVRFTPRLRDQRVCGCKMDAKVYMDSYMASNGSYVDYFQNPPLGGRPNTKSGDFGTSNAHNRWFLLFYHVWRSTWIEFIEITFGWGPSHIWLHTNLEGTWPHYMILKVCWMAFGHFLLGSHTFMVMALGSCVKWPYDTKSSYSLLIQFVCVFWTFS